MLNVKTGYESYSIERLFKCYQFENDRIDKADAAKTKRLIRQELVYRVNHALDILDTISDEKCVSRFYDKQFLQGR